MSVRNVLTVKTSSSPSSPSFWSAVEEVVEPTEEKIEAYITSWRNVKGNPSSSFSDIEMGRKIREDNITALQEHLGFLAVIPC